LEVTRVAVPGSGPSGLYSRRYYLEDCEGSREFLRSQGRRLPRRLEKCLKLLKAMPGDRIVDIGCGRGELALHAAAKGAVVLAVDPSPDALAIAREAAAFSKDAVPLAYVRADAEALPIRDGWADGAALADVLEHLPPERLQVALSECRRVLKRGARLAIHTEPNRTLVRFTAPILSRVSRLWRVRLPRDLRSEAGPGCGQDYHPDELSLGRLERALSSAGFAVEEIWLEGSYAVHRIFGETCLKRVVLRAFRRSGILKSLLATDIFAVARRR
jgi:SAM-dependent methyltransferase